MRPTYIGYDPAKIEEGDTVVSYPHNHTRARLHGDVVAIDEAANELRIIYNRTETSDGKMVEKGRGMATISKKYGTLSGTADVSTSLDIELIMKKQA